MEFKDSEDDGNYDYGCNNFRHYSWLNPDNNEESDLEYRLGKVLYRHDGKPSWVDNTGFIDDIEQADAVLSHLRREFKGEFLESGVMVLTPEESARHFVKYIRLRLNPLEKSRFEVSFADYLGCSRDEVADMALSC